MLSKFHRTVIRKSLPALAMVIAICISLVFLIRYTEAFYLVIILWIALPIIAIQAYRWLRDGLARKR